MKLEFRKFDNQSIAASELAWKKQAQAADMFPTEVEQAFEWARNRTELVNSEIVYGIFRPSEDEAIATVELFINQKSVKSKWIKMLHLRLSPATENLVYANQLDGYHEAMACFTTAVNGVFKLKNSQKGTVLKIYGRNQEQLSFLRALVGELKKRTKGHEYRMDGRWLVIESKEDL
jgi:hypothetical protein